jgi:hypothetical protein
MFVFVRGMCEVTRVICFVKDVRIYCVGFDKQRDECLTQDISNVEPSPSGRFGGTPVS